jgi:hypothetical protein
MSELGPLVDVEIVQRDVASSHESGHFAGRVVRQLRAKNRQRVYRSRRRRLGFDQECP